MEWIFWTSLILLVYLYLGYPLWLRVTRSGSTLPSLGEPLGQAFDVVIASHQEGPRLVEKIREVYEQGKDLGLHRLLVALDGPDPSLPQMASDMLAPGFPVKVFKGLTDMPDSSSLVGAGCAVIEFAEREGKASCLNRLLTAAHSEWVIFLDVRQRLDAGCLKSLLRHFSDSEVHVVSGNLEWEPTEFKNQTGEGVGVYWSYEKWIRQQESMRGKVPGATGACYALRRSFFSGIPNDTLVDDVLIPLQACSVKGQCRFEEEARLFDVPSRQPREEALRKRRTIAGILQLAVRHPGWNLPGGHPFWFQILSHKTLRLAGPVLLLAVFISNVLLLGDCVYNSLALGQGVFYLSALCAPWLGRFGWVGKLSTAARAFLLLNWSCMTAIRDVVFGRFQGGWERAYPQVSKNDSPGPSS